MLIRAHFLHHNVGQFCPTLIDWFALLGLLGVTILAHYDLIIGQLDVLLSRLVTVT